MFRLLFRCLISPQVLVPKTWGLKREQVSYLGTSKPIKGRNVKGPRAFDYGAHVTKQTPRLGVCFSNTKQEIHRNIICSLNSVAINEGTSVSSHGVWTERPSDGNTYSNWDITSSDDNKFKKLTQEETGTCLSEVPPLQHFKPNCQSHAQRVCIWPELGPRLYLAAINRGPITSAFETDPKIRAAVTNFAPAQEPAAPRFSVLNLRLKLWQGTSIIKNLASI